MEKKQLKNSLRPLHWLFAACLMVSVHANAQFGGFGFPPAMPGGMGMPGMPDMGGMFSQVKHTKADGLQSNLPIVTITTDTVLNAQKKVTAHMQVEDYDGAIGIKLRGNSSLGFNQKKYTLELRDEAGKKQNVSLLGMPAHSDWVLLAPYNDISMMRDPLAFYLWREMGHWGPRTQMVELVMDGEYHGIYIFCEAIKRGEERVNLSKMTKTDIEGTNMTGGYLLRIDTFNDDDATFPSKVSWHRVLVKSGPGNRGLSACGTTHQATSRISRTALNKNPMPGHLFESKPVDECTTRRGTDIPMHSTEKHADSKHRSTSVLSSLEELERHAEFRSSKQEKA